MSPAPGVHRMNRILTTIVARLASVVLLGAGLTGCQPPTKLVPGVYRATLSVPGGDLPFGFSIEMYAGKPIVYLRNGDESVTVSEIDHSGRRIVLRMPGYANTIEMTGDGSGYRGDAVMVRPGGKSVRLPFNASAGATYRFFPTPTENPLRVDGRWAITIGTTPGTTLPAIGEFRQDGAHVVGTIIDPTGDHRYLEGEVHGNEVLLSRFDGGSAYLYHATLSPDGTLQGKWWSGAWSVDDISGHRDDGATLQDPAEAAAAAHAAERFAFTFPDLDGKPVSFSDSRFRGKVVIVALGGSWCPNCHDEAVFLAPLYRALAPQGLEIVFLEFEHFGDFAAAAATNRRFATQFGIHWPVLIAGISEKDDAAAKLPMLGRVYAFPTTVVLDRKGNVRKVHSGFSGPATGQHYEDFQKEFTGLLHTLLDEKT